MLNESVLNDQLLNYQLSNDRSGILVTELYNSTLDN